MTSSSSSSSSSSPVPEKNTRRVEDWSTPSSAVVEIVRNINHKLREYKEQLQLLLCIVKSERTIKSMEKAKSFQSVLAVVIDALEHWNHIARAHFGSDFAMPAGPVATRETGELLFCEAFDASGRIRWSYVHAWVRHLRPELDHMYQRLSVHAWATWVVPEGSPWHCFYTSCQQQQQQKQKQQKQQQKQKRRVRGEEPEQEPEEEQEEEQD
jgi:hypothetical protein